MGETRQVACNWIVSPGTVSKHFDIRVDVCNPHWLFRGPWPLVFHRVGWIGGAEVLSKPSATSSLTVFVSYSWDSDDHKLWVLQLVEELRRHNLECLLDQKDLLPGEDATAFMERAIVSSRVTLLICTETYTRRADNREPGGVGFETIISSHEYANRCTAEERARFIPIIRDNALPKHQKLPRYLGSAIYVDMSTNDWRAEPMLRLVNAIRRQM